MGPMTTTTIITHSTGLHEVVTTQKLGESDEAYLDRHIGMVIARIAELG